MRPQPGAFEIVVPSDSVPAEPPVAVVDAVAAKAPGRGPRLPRVLYSAEGQEIGAKHWFRPTDEEGARERGDEFASLKLFTVDEMFGGWATSASAPTARLRSDLDEEVASGRDPVRESHSSEDERGSESDPGRVVRQSPARRPAMGFTLAYLSLVILIPLSTLFLKAATLPFGTLWETITAERTLAAFRLSLGSSPPRSSTPSSAPQLVAWVLERYPLSDAASWTARRSPFAADGVAGIALDPLPERMDRAVARAGRVPVAIRGSGSASPSPSSDFPSSSGPCSPVLRSSTRDRGSGGEPGRRTDHGLPADHPPRTDASRHAGFILAASARALRYGSVIFIAGNLPMETESRPSSS